MPQQGFNINNFKSQIDLKGVQRPNKFVCIIPMPSGLQGSTRVGEWSTVASKLEFWCEAASVPGVALSTHQVIRYGYGAFEKKPFAPIFSDVNLTFISDGKSTNWDFFYSWIKMIHNFDLRRGINVQGTSTSIVNGIRLDSFETAYKSDYFVDLNIICHDDTGNEINRVILRDAYPIYVGEIALNWADNNSFSKLPVTFTFMDWYSELVGV